MESLLNYHYKLIFRCSWEWKRFADKVHCNKSIVYFFLSKYLFYIFFNTGISQTPPVVLCDHPRTGYERRVRAPLHLSGHHLQQLYLQVGGGGESVGKSEKNILITRMKPKLILLKIPLTHFLKPFLKNKL